MATLPPYLAVPCPCFTYVAVDLAGPFVVKKEGASKVTRRNSGTLKVWAVLIVCLQTKAVKIYMVGGLGTEDFLLAWDTYKSDHGKPMVAHSDRGPNLVSAAKEGVGWNTAWPRGSLEELAALIFKRLVTLTHP